MAAKSSIARLRPKLQSVFGLLNSTDDTEIRNILSQTDQLLLELARHFGSNRAGWEGTGLDLTWYPAGQVEISSFVGTRLDGNHCVDFIVSLTPNWAYDDFPIESAWEIEAEIEADCQHEVYCGCMHIVHRLPTVCKTHPIDAAIALRDMTTELLQLGKDEPLEFWLHLAGE